MTTDLPFPIVTDGSLQPELAGSGWESYPRLAVLKGVLDDLAADIVKRHADEGAPIDHAVLQYERWLFQEAGRSLEAAAAQADYQWLPQEPSHWSTFDEMVLDAHLGIGRVAVEWGRHLAASGVAGPQAERFLNVYRYDLARSVLRAFDNQLLGASLNASSDSGDQP